MAYVSVPTYNDRLYLSFERKELTDRQLRGLKLLFDGLNVVEAYDKTSKKYEKNVEIGGIKFTLSIAEAFVCEVVGEEEIPATKEATDKAADLLTLTPEQAFERVQAEAAALLAPIKKPIYNCEPVKDEQIKDESEDFQF